METLRIGIVGAGFAGLYAAYKLSRNHQITVFEEDKHVGKPKHCTGLVSKWTAEKIGEPAEKSMQAVYDKIVFSAGREEIVFNRPSIAVKLDRVMLEEELYKESLNNGVKAFTGCKVLSVDPGKNVIHTSKCGEYRFDAVIIADGFYGKVSRSLGIDRSMIKRVVGINIEVQPTSHPVFIEPNTFKVVFHKVFKGFFSWILRLPNGKILVGAGRRGEPINRNELIKWTGIRGFISDAYGGTILTGPPVDRPYILNVFVIGDAAGLTKPFTGGGLYPNVKLVECFNNTGLSGWRKCMDNIVSELKAQTRVANIFHEDLKYTDLEELFRTMKESGFADLITANIDYDKHEELFHIAMSNKRLFLSMGLKYMVKKPLAASKIVYRLIKGKLT
jgi:digeranylgeranylglycerophospholipid reductase